MLLDLIPSAAIAALPLRSVPFVALDSAARIHLAPLARKQGVSEGVALLRQLLSALCDLLFALLAAEQRWQHAQQGGRVSGGSGAVAAWLAVAA